MSHVYLQPSPIWPLFMSQVRQNTSYSLITAFSWIPLWLCRHTTPSGVEGLSTYYPTKLNLRRIHQSLIPPYSGSQPTRHSFWWGRTINGRPNKTKLAADTSKAIHPGITTKPIPAGTLPEPNPIWRVFPALTEFGYEFGFSTISKHGYGTGNR